MKKLLSILLAMILLALSCACFAEESAASDKEAIEAALNLANNPDQEWTYNASADAWTLSVVMAVTPPVIENAEGVSVCVPGAPVTFPIPLRIKYPAWILSKSPKLCAATAAFAVKCANFTVLTHSNRLATP